MPAIRPVLFHWRAKDEVRVLPRDVRVKLGTALMALQRGFNLARRRLTEMLNEYEEVGRRT
jgi:phage-related protein